MVGEHGQGCGERFTSFNYDFAEVFVYLFPMFKKVFHSGIKKFIQCEGIYVQD